MINSKKDIMIVVCIIICIAGPYFFFAGVAFIRSMHLEVKAIPAEYNSETETLQYDGRTYQVIDTYRYDHYYWAEKDLLGRVKWTSRLLYCYENDLDKSVLMMDTYDKIYVFSDKYSEIPTDGEVTGIHVALAKRGKSKYEGYYSRVKDEHLKSMEEVALFRALWEERHKNEPIIPKDGRVIDELDYIWVRFCFEDCPAPGAASYIVFYNEEWYWVENKFEDQKHCYLIENEEVTAYLADFMQYEEF